MFIKATVVNMMLVFAKAAQTSIKITVKEKIKSFEPPTSSTISTKDKLHSEIKNLLQQLTMTPKTGEGTNMTLQNVPAE